MKRKTAQKVSMIEEYDSSGEEIDLGADDDGDDSGADSPQCKKIKLSLEIDQHFRSSSDTPISAAASPFYVNHGRIMLCTDVVRNILQFLPFFQTVKLMRVSSSWKQAQKGSTKAKIKETIKKNILNKFLKSPVFKNVTHLVVEAKLDSKQWTSLFKSCENLALLRIKYLTCVALPPTIHNTNLSKLRVIYIGFCLFSPGTSSDLKYAFNNPYLYNLKELYVENIGLLKFPNLIYSRAGLTDLKLDNISARIDSPTSTFRLGLIQKLDLNFTGVRSSEIESMLGTIFSSPQFIQLTFLRLKTKKSFIANISDLIGKESNLINLSIGKFGDALLSKILQMKFNKLETLNIDHINSRDVIQAIEDNPTLWNLKHLSIRQILTNCEQELAFIPEKLKNIEVLEITQSACVEDMQAFFSYPYQNLKKLYLKWRVGDSSATDIGVDESFQKLDKLTLCILPHDSATNGNDLLLTLEPNFSNIKNISFHTSIKLLAVTMYGTPMDNVEILQVYLYDDESAQALIQNKSFHKLRAIKIKYDPSGLTPETLDALTTRFKNYNMKLYYINKEFVFVISDQNLLKILRTISRIRRSSHDPNTFHIP